jgi:hypothetical protein
VKHLVNKTQTRRRIRFGVSYYLERVRGQAETTAKESKSGGTIFEYARRCSHTSNYLQAPHLVALVMHEKFSPGLVVGHP